MVMIQDANDLESKQFRVFYLEIRELPGIALVNCGISHIFTIIYLGGEVMYQKCENMLSFQMTPSNYWYVIFMWAKRLHRVKTE